MFYNTRKTTWQFVPEEVIQMIEFEKGRSDKIAKNFQYKEFDCHGQGCCSTTIIDEKLVDEAYNRADTFYNVKNTARAYLENYDTIISKK